MTQPDSLAAIIAEMREPENSGQFGPWQFTTDNIKDWADRLAALAGAAPVAWVNAADPMFRDDWSATTPILYRQQMTNTVPLFPHAPAKAREDVLLPLLRDMWAETVSHAEMWGQRPDDALRDRYLAALATFAEGS